MRILCSLCTAQWVLQPLFFGQLIIRPPVSGFWATGACSRFCSCVWGVRGCRVFHFCKGVRCPESACKAFTSRDLKTRTSRDGDGDNAFSLSSLPLPILVRSHVHLGFEVYGVRPGTDGCIVWSLFWVWRKADGRVISVSTPLCSGANSQIPGSGDGCSQAEASCRGLPGPVTCTQTQLA